MYPALFDPILLQMRLEKPNNQSIGIRKGLAQTPTSETGGAGAGVLVEAICASGAI